MIKVLKIVSDFLSHLTNFLEEEQKDPQDLRT